jgi:molybdenum cofactor biosynthesis protein B
MSHVHHKAQAPQRVRVFVLTVSDTRTEETDEGGRLIRELACAPPHEHEVAGYALVQDEPAQVQQRIQSVAKEGSADVLISTGGTGISRRDSTYEAVNGLLSKRLDGFGELFRMLSYKEIGSAAMLSRAVAGLVADSNLVVFALPGSKAAVRLAMEKLILPELGHLKFEAHRGS